MKMKYDPTDTSTVAVIEDNYLETVMDNELRLLMNKQ